MFLGEKEIFRAMYVQVGEEEQVISSPYTPTPLDASMRGRKKRNQGEDMPWLGSQRSMGSMLRALVCMTRLLVA